MYALPGVIPQLAVACCWFAWDAFALYIVFLIANGMATDKGELMMSSSCANSIVCISGAKYVFLFILICFK